MLREMPSQRTEKATMSKLNLGHLPFRHAATGILTCLPVIMMLFESSLAAAQVKIGGVSFSLPSASLNLLMMGE